MTPDADSPFWLQPDVPLPCSSDMVPGDVGVDDEGRIEEQYDYGSDE